MKRPPFGRGARTEKGTVPRGGGGKKGGAVAVKKGPVTRPERKSANRRGRQGKGVVQRQGEGGKKGTASKKTTPKRNQSVPEKKQKEKIPISPSGTTVGGEERGGTPRAKRRVPEKTRAATADIVVEKQAKTNNVGWRKPPAADGRNENARPR